jgi:N-acetyl-gamma-glutamyl-phosphate reductase
VRPRRPLDGAEAREVLDQAYGEERFVRVLPAGATPDLASVRATNFPELASVRGTNFCDVAAVADPRNGTLVLLSALDNLVKGAGGQAVQCANLMRGLPEELGLLDTALLP